MKFIEFFSKSAILIFILIVILFGIKEKKNIFNLFLSGVIEGEKMVIRILDYKRSLQGIEALGFSDSNYQKILKMISVPNGIILVTGATGSGKSTTVYSILQRLNKEETNIITVEDPIEMSIEGINQVQTNSEIGLTFASALRSILRQDPNIVMIGEIRDSETAQIAVVAAWPNTSEEIPEGEVSKTATITLNYQQVTADDVGD